MKQSNTKPKFQFSMKTLILGIILAAILSTVAGWLGFQGSLKALIAITQIGIVLGSSIWGILLLLTKTKPTAVATRIVFSVALSAISYFLCFTVIAVCFMKIQHTYGDGIEAVDSLSGMFSYWLSFILFTNIVLISVLASLLVPLLVAGSIAGSYAKRKKKSGPKASKRMAAIAGMFVGFLMLPALEITNATSQLNPLYFSLLPSVFGLILPPCILTWADWLRAKELKHQALLQPEVQEECTVSETKNIL